MLSLTIPRIGAGQITSPLYGSAELDDDISLAVGSVQGFWTREFSRLWPGRGYAPVQRIFAYDTTRIADPTGVCRPKGLNAFYCGAGDAIFYELPHFLQSLHANMGDFSVAIVLAHEFGHAVQRRLAPGRPQRAAPIEYELEADCFAGAWASYAENDDPQLRLEDGDIDEGVLGLFNGRDPIGYPWLDPDAHGTALQRIEAFLLGYRAGAIRCLGSMPPPPRRR